jgi:hypothetical protein
VSAFLLAHLPRAIFTLSQQSATLCFDFLPRNKECNQDQKFHLIDGNPDPACTPRARFRRRILMQQISFGVFRATVSPRDVSLTIKEWSVQNPDLHISRMFCLPLDFTLDDDSSEVELIFKKITKVALTIIATPLAK